MNNITRENLLSLQTGSVNVVQALSGLKLLLEELAGKSQDQADELCSCTVILKLITKQAEEMADALLLLN